MEIVRKYCLFTKLCAIVYVGSPVSSHELAIVVNGDRMTLTIVSSHIILCLFPGALITRKRDKNVINI